MALKDRRQPGLIAFADPTGKVANMRPVFATDSTLHAEEARDVRTFNQLLPACFGYDHRGRLHEGDSVWLRFLLLEIQAQKGALNRPVLKD